jgi:hypothetical protein
MEKPVYTHSEGNAEIIVFAFFIMGILTPFKREHLFALFSL